MGKTEQPEVSPSAGLLLYAAIWLICERQAPAVRETDGTGDLYAGGKVPKPKFLIEISAEDPGNRGQPLTQESLSWIREKGTSSQGRA